MMGNMEARNSSAIWLALGVSLAFATQWRLSESSIGVGEILLLAWVIAAAANALRRNSFALTDRESPFVTFWAVFFAGLAVGYINAVFRGVAPPAGTANHDTLAYLFSASICIVFVASCRRECEENFAYLLALCLSMPAVLLWLIGLHTERLFGHDLWLTYRFQGWAGNPNQAALSVLLAPFLFFHHLERRKPARGLLIVTCVIAGLTVLAGWATASSAGRLAWTVCLPLLVIVPLIATNRREEAHARKLMTAAALAVAILMIGNSMVGLETRSVNPEPKAASGDIATQVAGVYLNKDIGKEVKIGIRMTLLANAAKAIQASYGLGFGPGCFSGFDGPLGLSEAHNSLIDAGTNGGVLVMVALLALLAKTAVRLWRTRHDALLIGLLALSIFAQFHHILRHPLVWVFLAYLWLAGREARPATA